MHSFLLYSHSNLNLFNMKTFLKENFFKFMIGLSAFIVSIAILMYIISITKSPSSLNERVTGDPIRIGRLEIAEFDFINGLNYYEARKACKKLGYGWRLPTKYELNLMYLNKDKIGGFEDFAYRSSTYWSGKNYNHLETTNEKSWIQSFANGYRFYFSNDANCCVRAVRSF